jgi:glycosyltransferase 2 family protein
MLRLAAYAHAPPSCHPRLMPRWIKLLVTVALLAALAAAVDWQALPAHLEQLHWVPFALAILVTGAQMPVNAWKWRWSLRLHDSRVSLPFLLRASCGAFFLNNFLPSAIGGDVYRVIRTAPAGGGKTTAISAVLIERLVGLAALLVNGFIGALMLASHNDLARTYLEFALVAAVVFIGAAALLYHGGFAMLSRGLARIALLAPLAVTVQSIARMRSEWLGLALASFLFQVLVAVVVYLAFQSVGAPISPAAALLIAAAGGIASVLPISISGIGVVEGAIAGTAVALGVAYEPAVLAAIANRLIVLPVSAACGLVYLLDDGARVRTA